VYRLARHPLLWNDEDTLGDILAIYRILPSLFSVHEYLAARVDMLAMLPLTTGRYFPFSARADTDGSERWVTEVNIWFVEVVVDAILTARFGARYPLNSDSEKFGEVWKRKYATCDRILFRDRAYTNVN
jgi:hypothetical protein